jgi:predicted GTPase
LTAYSELTNFLLSVPLNKLLTFADKQCNCIGHPKYYIQLSQDVFNNELKLRHLTDINVTYKFVAGTIFYCPANVLNKTLEFMTKNYKSYLFNNLYENNTINMHKSPIHFLERVYGIIKC